MPAEKPKPRGDEKKKTEAGSARITVRLPADAKLTVDGVECPLTSAKRAFETPTLEAGKKYYYDFKAEVVRNGKVQTESKRVVFEAGSNIDVEIPLTVETASR